jgi:hypothetical protein
LNAELNYYHSKYPSEKRPQQPKDSPDAKAVNIKNKETFREKFKRINDILSLKR